MVYFLSVYFMTLTHDLQCNNFIDELIHAQYLTTQSAADYYRDAQRQNSSFIDYLVVKKIVPSRIIASKMSVVFGLPLFDLDSLLVEELPDDLMDEVFILKYGILPIKIRGDTLFIAISDPFCFQCFDEIRLSSHLNPEPILVEIDKLKNRIQMRIDGQNGSLSDFFLEHHAANFTLLEDENKILINNNVDDSPMVRFVNKLLQDAIKQGVSDIHVECYEKACRIRYRIDGVLTLVISPPFNMANQLISRIKVMSKMDIAERRLPQDGRITLLLEQHRSIDFRVSTCPTLFGEKVVLRVLDSANAQWHIEKLGFDSLQQSLFLAAINKPYGMVLVTGPTGSGKTVTLYTGLDTLNTPERNISTVEDPVEIAVEGINQVNIHPKVGLTFASVLRAFLRQDPDVIMVGEIRDLETAEIAIKAAQTGHLVLSTLHTNDAPQTINRLMQMGVPAFNVVSAINLIVAQRLVRRLCEACKVPVHYPKSLLLAAGFTEQESDSLCLFQAVGCGLCSHGFRGRIAIYQVMPLSEKMRMLILQGANTLELAEQANAERIDDLRVSGLNKVRAGVTSLEELNRVTLDN
ncbi:MAG: type pilus assembly protein PilB [Pseudomonadota bacterium]|nr:type pilus assembly protein PilB [Pseudomonadota bacterium]